MAFVIMLIVAIVQKRTINSLHKDLSEISEKGWREATGYGKVYKKRYKLIVVRNAGDNTALNYTIKMNEDLGYSLDIEHSTDYIIYMVKHEEVE